MPFAMTNEERLLRFNAVSPAKHCAKLNRFLIGHVEISGVGQTVLAYLEAYVAVVIAVGGGAL